MPRSRVREFFSFLCFTQQGRMWCILFFCSLFFAHALRSLHKAQLKPNEFFVKTPEDFTQKLPAMRGGIFDRNGRPLAVSYPLWMIHVDSDNVPPDQADQEKIFEAIMGFGIEGCDGEKIYEALQVKQGHYSPLGRTDNRDVIESIRTNALLRRCVGVNNVANRVYPAGRSMCHIVGFANSNNEPQLGIELSMDKWLRGTDGYIRGKKTVRGREIREMRKELVPATNGCSVVLTIDEELQDVVGQALDKVFEERHPKGAWAIVENPKTGEILAMASRPDFDPADWGTAPVETQRNLAIFHQYEPGSVMKSVAAAAALSERLTSPNEIFNCRPRLYAGRPLEDHLPVDRTTWQRKYDLTLGEVLAYSSNGGASQLAEKLGKARLEKYFRAFGFGEKTGIPLSGEARGDLGLRPNRPWSDLQGLRVAIGQGIAVTAIQLISFYSTVANGGHLMQPILVKEIRDGAGNAVQVATPKQLRSPMSSETARQLREMLTGTTKFGTAKMAAVAGYEVAGKTGTSEIAVRGGYAKNRRCASFVGMLPADDPQLVILVTVFDLDEKPWSGGAVAAPVFSEIATAAAAHLRLPADPSVFGPPPFPVEEVVEESTGWAEEEESDYPAWLFESEQDPLESF